jgi:hypothetical protein
MEQDHMGNTVIRIVCFLLVLLPAVPLFTSPVQAFYITAFEQPDRNAPVSQALIYSDGQYVGITDRYGIYNLTYEGEPPKILVKKSGYHEWAGTPSRNDTLLLVPLQVRNCSYTILISDADTMLPVKGARVVAGTGGFLIQQGITGPDGTIVLPLRAEQVYNLTISVENYHEIREKLVTGTEDTRVRYSPIRTDRITIRVKDSRDGHPVTGTEITVDNRSAGMTNDTGILVTNLTRETGYSLEAAAPGYEKTKMEVTPGVGDQVIELTLIKQKLPIVITVYDQNKNPVEGAEIRINNNSTGLTNRYGRLTVPGLEAGDYEVMVSRGGLENQSRSVVLSPGKSDIIFDMEPEKSRITFRVENPAGFPLSHASVQVNGSDSGSTDAGGMVNITLEAGRTYLVSASMPGYDVNNTTVTPPAPAPVILVISPQKQGTGAISPALILLACGLVAIIVTGILYSRSRWYKQSHQQKKQELLKRRSL